MFKMDGFYGRPKEALGTEVDIVSEKAVNDDFSKEALRDRSLLYEA